MKKEEGELKLTFEHLTRLELALLVSIIHFECKIKYSRNPDYVERWGIRLQEWRELLQLTSELYPQRPRDWDLPSGSRNDHE